MRSGRALVVGGGITGLVAARALAMRGIPVTLVEAGERLGGRIRTERGDGFLVEEGPDSFLTLRPAALDLVRELGLEDALIAPGEPRRVFVRHRSTLVPIPDGVGLGIPTRLAPLVRTPLFSLPEKLRMAGDLVRPRLLGPDDVAVGTFLRSRLGTPLVDRLAGPLVGGVYGTPVDELSLDAVMPQLRLGERDHRSILLAGLAQGRVRAPSVPADGRATQAPFVSLRDGMATIVRALEAALVAAGVEIVTGRAVRELARQGSGVSVRLSDGEHLTADGVVVTAPGPVAAALLEPEVPGAARPLATIPHGTSTLVTLGYPRAAVGNELAGHGYLVPRGQGSTVAACTWSSAKWPDRAPDDAVLLRVSLRAEELDIVGSRESDDAIVAAARADVEHTLSISGRPELVRLTRWSGTMPRYTVGHLERVAAVETGMTAWPSVVVAGASYRGMGLPDCIVQGTAAAERLAARLGAVAIEHERDTLAATA